jgi:hypothetical protein
MESIGYPSPCSLLLKGKIFSIRVGLVPEKDRERELLRPLQASGEGFSVVMGFSHSKEILVR